MALPFLAMGLGLLGGKAYLQSKEDARTADETLQQAESWLANRPDWAAQNAGYLEQLENLRTNQGFFSDDTGLAQSYLQNMQRDYDTQQAQAEADKARRIAATNQFDQDWARDVGQFAEVVQPSFQKALLALEDPNSADSVAALYNFFNIIEPGGRVTENEDGSFRGIGGSGGRIANWLNEMRGEGLSDVTRDQIIESIWKQYTPEYERAVRQKGYYEKLMETSQGMYGQGIQSPIGRQGIDWSLQQDPRQVQTETVTEGQPKVPTGWRLKD
jgi:hypothetical protein